MFFIGCDRSTIALASALSLEAVLALETGHPGQRSGPWPTNTPKRPSMRAATYAKFPGSREELQEDLLESFKLFV